MAVLLAFVFSAGHGDAGGSSTGSTASAGAVLAALTLPPLPANPAADAGCTAFSVRRPTSLDGGTARPVRGSSTFVWAYGQPPVIVRCGVGRPTELTAQSGAQLFYVGVGATSALWLPAANNHGTVFTVVDRAVYLEVTVPTSGDAGAVLPIISAAVAQALPAVCQAVPSPYPSDPPRNLETTFCTRRP